MIQNQVHQNASVPHPNELLRFQSLQLEKYHQDQSALEGGYALEYVKNPTENICFMAVQQDGLALELVYEQTDEICKMAVQQNGNALKFVKVQTEEICVLAVQQNEYAVKYINNRYRFVWLFLLYWNFNN